LSWISTRSRRPGHARLSWGHRLSIDTFKPIGARQAREANKPLGAN
jgi:hypothetical protein